MNDQPPSTTTTDAQPDESDETTDFDRVAVQLVSSLTPAQRLALATAALAKNESDGLISSGNIPPQTFTTTTRSSSDGSITPTANTRNFYANGIEQPLSFQMQQQETHLEQQLRILLLQRQLQLIPGNSNSTSRSTNFYPTSTATINPQYSTSSLSESQKYMPHSASTAPTVAEQYSIPDNQSAFHSQATSATVPPGKKHRKKRIGNIMSGITRRSASGSDSGSIFSTSNISTAATTASKGNSGGWLNISRKNSPNIDSGDEEDDESDVSSSKMDLGKFLSSTNKASLAGDSSGATNKSTLSRFGRPGLNSGGSTNIETNSGSSPMLYTPSQVNTSQNAALPNIDTLFGAANNNVQASGNIISPNPNVMPSNSSLHQLNRNVASPSPSIMGHHDSDGSEFSFNDSDFFAGLGINSDSDAGSLFGSIVGAGGSSGGGPLRDVEKSRVTVDLNHPFHCVFCGRSVQ
ncbi:hypothetical protein HK100_003913 [Physocladia obscura]|uniref:Uncharacterized protein n=1 Tax=Physocladia obscura TaxID=109957 RepID=A0AAD5T878_9FUNG|nr:hypothetical protein HK100_003913 [Physocladia obscura]